MLHNQIQAQNLCENEYHTTWPSTAKILNKFEILICEPDEKSRDM